MSKIRSWTDEQLTEAVEVSYSVRNVIILLGLIPAGGNYEQVKKRIRELDLTTHQFTGSRWNVGKRYHVSTRIPLKDLLKRDVITQSYKLKLRLYEAKLKEPVCELCGWHKTSQDGRLPLELDHINGDHYDNRLKNLRILCPNCHSLQSTHRGKNKGAYT